MLAFHIGGSDAEFVRVENLCDNGDGWFSSDVLIAVGGFRASYAASFYSGSFSRFAEQLEQLHSGTARSATFSSHERQLELALTDDALGHIRVRGEAMDEAGTGNELRFELERDQSDLPAIIRSLKAISR